MHEINYTASKTLARFHASDAFVRGVRGPVGSGKSVGMCIEILARGHAQAPDAEGVRRTRWAVVRNTYGELKTTTIKTWQAWVPELVAPIKWDSPIVSMFECALPDGTRIQIEVLFMSLDRPEDVKKLKSLDLTGVWLNEASELPKAVLDMATGRVGRYPSKAMGGCTWSGIIMDTNSPDDDHWWYELAEDPDADEVAQRADLEAQLRELGILRADQSLYEWFHQPGALLRDGARYVPNPAAENVENHTEGYGYWLKQIAGKSSDWIKVYVLGEYGTIHDGKPVYSDWSEDLHLRKIEPVPGIKLTIGFDFGLTPAAVIAQVDARGRLRVIDELCAEDMGFRRFLDEVLIPQLGEVYPEWWKARDKMIECIGDPAGAQRAQHDDEATCYAEAKAVGLIIEPAETNDFVPRRAAVEWFLTRIVDGKPALALDPVCTVLRKGFNGGYKYRRVQVSGQDERFTSEPVKNKYSHPHDGLQYIALKYGSASAMKKQSIPKRKQEVRADFTPLDAALGY